MIKLIEILLNEEEVVSDETLKKVNEVFLVMHPDYKEYADFILGKNPTN